MNLTDAQILIGLEEVAERELNRHLSSAVEWFPHAYVPWSRGRDFDGVMDGEPWRPEQSQLSELGRIALKVNLLTEDNLPRYHRQIVEIFGRDAAWGTWVDRWTAEEARHSIVIRDYLVTSRAVDPVDLERARMAHMSAPAPADGSVLEVIAYVTLQELATRVSHRNTGLVVDDPVCDRLLARVAKDENLHMIFYRNMLEAALELAPDQGMRAVTDVVKGFSMPGEGIAGFQRAAVRIAVGGIYNPRIHHDSVLDPVLRHLDVLGRGGLGPEGQRAQDELGDFLAGLREEAERFEERRRTLLARRERRAGAGR